MPNKTQQESKHSKKMASHTDDKKANILNEQFQSVFSPKSPLSLASLCKMKPQDMYDRGYNTTDKLSPHSNMPDINLSTDGISKLLKNLKPHKAAGLDQIKSIVLKTLHFELSPIIHIIFQKSLESGYLPEIWKSANISPIFKKGDRYKASNYRPISLTCILCKTLEHIIASSIVKHFTKLNIFYHLQHGFREKRSCETQLIMLIEDLSKTMQTGKQTDLILLDFSKAFDKVAHEKLFSKLHFYGIRGQTLCLIKSFLDNRNEKVVLNGEISDEIPVSSGVPQGSVLGPILFLAYTNDLPDNLKSKVRLFADDTGIYFVISKPSDFQTLQNDLALLEQWEKKWDMEFNPSKCQVIHITKSKTPIKNNYFLHGIQLESVPSAKYLGIDVSEDLSWSPHINRICKKANQTLGFLRRNLKIKNESVKAMAFKTLVRPQLEYASVVWSPHSAKLIHQLESVQRRAARWVKNDYRQTSSVTAMLESLSWRRLDLRRIDARLSLLYKITNDLVAIPIQPYLSPITRPTRTSHNLAFRQISTSKDFYKFSFFPRTIVHWNLLPQTVVNLPTADQFNLAVSNIPHISP